MKQVRRVASTTALVFAVALRFAALLLSSLADVLHPKPIE